MKQIPSLIRQTFILLIFISVACSKNGKVKMYEESMVIPTYEVGEPEENPIFYTPRNYQGAQMHVYPYKLLNKLSETKTDKNYKAVILENEYIKVCVLPELGGRLYMAQDKSNGYNFFYHNNVIKPALIGMAGAWISGGIEWNIPHHHRVSTFMPVDYRLVENSDGSKTVWVGEYEKRHDSKWCVGLTLRPGKSYIEGTIKIFNTTPEIQSFLIWANTAVHANENYQVVFPPDVERAVFHSKVQFTDWPVSKQIYQGIDYTKGVNVSWWKNTWTPTSFFAWDTEQDFLSGIDHGKNAGTMIIGDHNICKGKKMWNWGNNEVARLWDKKLTDKDGTYLELMMGAYSDNQPDYSWNAPFNTKSATMFYYPIKNLTGVKEANANIAANLELINDSVLIEVNSTNKGNYNILLMDTSANELFKDVSNISPVAPYQKKILLKGGYSAMAIKLVVTDGSGQQLISWQPKPKKNDPAPEVYKAPADPSKMTTVEELFLAGLRLEQFYNPDYNPMAYYSEALKRDKDNILVNTQVGIWYLKKSMYDKAEEYLKNAYMSVTGRFTVPKYAEPVYYYGLCLMNEKRYKEAYKILNTVTWSREWLSPASLLLAKMDCRNSNLTKALQYIEASINANPENIEALLLKGITLRHLGKYDDALSSIYKAIDIDPLSLIAFNELYLLRTNTKTGKSLKDHERDFKQIMRDEPDNYLQVATVYSQSGFYEDASNVIEFAAGSANKKLSEYPMISYYQGYYTGMKGNKAKTEELLQKAAALPIRYCFPFGDESADALNYAANLNKTDSHAHYLLGNIYCDNQPEKALAEWQAAVELNLNQAVAFRNISFIYGNILNNMPLALENIKKAISLDPNDPLYPAEADQMMQYMKYSPSTRLSFLSSHLETLKKMDDSYGRYVILCIIEGRLDEALKELKEKHFHGREGTELNYHVAWVDANMLKGIEYKGKGDYQSALKHFNAAMEFPFNLENARDAKSAIAYYELALTKKLMNDEKGYRQNLDEMINFQSSHGWGAGEWPEVSYFKALALKLSNRTLEANEILNTLVKEGKDFIANPTQHEALFLTSIQMRERQVNALVKAYYKCALGYLGLGNKALAHEMLQKVLELDPSNYGALNIEKY